QGWRVVYPLPEILLLVLCATLCGMEDFVEIRMWGEQRLDFLRRFLAYERGLPAHDTLNDVINALDPVSLPDVLFCLGRDVARARARHRRHRRQDLATNPRARQGPPTAAHGQRLGRPSAPGSGAGGGR